MKIPQHVAIILDGNGRWAKSKGMPRNYGHTVGAKNVETVCQAAHDLGIKYVTMYAFSTENWNRPDSEVAALMKLLESYLKNCIRTADRNNMRVRVIGDTAKLTEKFRNQIRNRHQLLHFSGIDRLRKFLFRGNAVIPGTVQILLYAAGGQFLR